MWILSRLINWSSGGLSQLVAVLGNVIGEVAVHGLRPVILNQSEFWSIRRIHSTLDHEDAAVAGRGSGAMNRPTVASEDG